MRLVTSKSSFRGSGPARPLPAPRPGPGRLPIGGRGDGAARCLPASEFLVLAVAVLASCAFDVVQVKQLPIAMTATTAVGSVWELQHDVKAKLGTSYPTDLRAGTRWSQVGTSDRGDVFATRDQIVTVEASHIHEADLVVSNRFLTGFLLKREKTFAPLVRPVPIELQPIPDR